MTAPLMAAGNFVMNWLWRMAASGCSISNGGESDARNVGLQQTQGKYFYLLDSDDLIRSTALAQFVEHCEADGADAALTPLEMFSTEQPEGGRKIRTRSQSC